MEKINISLMDLLDILKEYDEDKFDAEPLNARSFCQYIFDKYNKSERRFFLSKPTDEDMMPITKEDFLNEFDIK